MKKPPGLFSLKHWIGVCEKSSPALERSLYFSHPGKASFKKFCGNLKSFINFTKIFSLLTLSLVNTLLIKTYSTQINHFKMFNKLTRSMCNLSLCNVNSTSSLTTIEDNNFAVIRDFTMFNLG